MGFVNGTGWAEHMKNWAGYLVPAGLLALFILVGFLLRPAPLTEADTVAPVLVSRPQWVAGRTGDLEVRLVARLASGGVRQLDFLGADDPVATITFYQGEVPLSPPVTVTLSHRC